MTYFLRNGNTFRVTDEASLDLHEKLPVGNYIIKKDQFGNLFLEQIDSFELKGKRYGDNTKNTDRIYSTFMNREASTGVMLTGEKGSGKTMLAKALAIKCAEEAIPCIIINAAWVGDAFNKLIQDINQPCMVLFDEFEKVYDREEQQSILTLLDGVFPSKKLFVLTCNDKWRVDAHMRNRPGRIFYMLDFKGLAVEFIVEYCEDNLINKTHISKICSIASLFAEFNFDMLKALVEEMNRYNETPQEALRMLNAKPEFDSGANYNVGLYIEGKLIPTKVISPEVYNGNPLNPNGVCISFDQDPDDEDSDWKEYDFEQADLQSIEPAHGRFTFQSKDGNKLILTKVVTKTFNFDAF